jgi:hypothetical protein
LPVLLDCIQSLKIGFARVKNPGEVGVAVTSERNLMNASQTQKVAKQWLSNLTSKNRCDRQSTTTNKGRAQETEIYARLQPIQT